jgi:hypothetical protein
MGQASGSRQSIGYIAETAYGVTPATPVFKALRNNGNSLALDKTIFQSQELRADRQIPGITHGLISAKGSINTELSNHSHDDFMEAALGGTWTTNVLKNGILRKSFTIERDFQDIGEYIRYLGMEIDTWDLKATVGGIVTSDFGFMGQSVAVAEAIIAGATYPAAGVTQPMNALSGTVQEGGSAIAVVSEVNLSLKNGLAARNVIGSNMSLEPSIGRSDLTGSMVAYFETAALYNKFVQETISSLAFHCSDGTNSFDFLVPKLKYTSGDVPTNDEGPVSISMNFQGLYDSVTGTNLQITRSS